MFIECELNRRFFAYVKQVVMNTFDINILINTHCLLKIDNAEEADVVITVAFWCIYKMLILRNKMDSMIEC